MAFLFKEHISARVDQSTQTNSTNDLRLDLSDQRGMGSGGIFRLGADFCHDLAPNCGVELWKVYLKEREEKRRIRIIRIKE